MLHLRMLCGRRAVQHHIGMWAPVPHQLLSRMDVLPAALQYQCRPPSGVLEHCRLRRTRRTARGWCAGN